MPHKVMDDWFISNRPHAILGRKFRPLGHPRLPGSPLSIRRGQAEAFYLQSLDPIRIRTCDCSSWILKKFHPQWELDRSYSRRVAGLLPRVPACASGFERRVLDASVAKGLPTELARWLDGTILMPRVRGCDWTNFADQIRGGTVSPQDDERLLLCRNLAQLVSLLEDNGLSHRDISSANVFIVPRSFDVCLIDWDSLFHQSLPMPRNTTCGTPGYAAPFACVDGRARADVLWNAQGDRFALAIICAEFLTLERNSPVAGEGGLFDQRELDQGTGRALAVARRRLASRFPRAAVLFDQALGARGGAACPSPAQWLRACRPVPAPPYVSAAVTRLGDNDSILQVTRRSHSSARLPTTPDFTGFTSFSQRAVAPTLPSNPWRT